ncbi:CoA transferase [Nocardioides sp. QY071]|uniref:CaiB/BaiF CoA transferase family protein n=1 Tax=Nocardioides sp. QY071 TaxID=3044187 RepID=UPI00249A873D|nr:CoA transferase [Nocardioides sp. QY071]WGY00377.1 CoA transferase [Nocardioides sp. QY071]
MQRDESHDQTPPPGFLDGVRVLEIGGELGEYCGKVLAGLGADVVRVEQPGGDATRSFGPFLDDEPHPDRSLYFWHYNFAKRSITVDLDAPSGQDRLRRLAAVADVVLDSRPRGHLAERGLGHDRLSALNPGLITSRISPFGDTGPWADHLGSDLVHLALGGVMMNCGYDPDPAGRYETPPVAPQMWQAYQITGEMAAMAVIAALVHRLGTGTGQQLSTSVHQAVSQNTETDVPDWVYLAQTHYRLTCRHSTTTSRSPALSATKDGRYLLPYRTYVRTQNDEWDSTVTLLRRYGMHEDLDDPRYATPYRDTDEARGHLATLVDRLVGRLMYDRDLWREAQELDMPWTPIRRPEENATDEHWLQRGAFFDVHHPELDRTFTYVGGKWVTEGLPWRRGPRPPLVGEHDGVVDQEWLATPRPATRTSPRRPRAAAAPDRTSALGTPFALDGVRVVDLSWMLASAGAGRFLSALGADVIKVEHLSRPDRMRFSPLGACPPGGRAERDAASGPLPTPDTGGISGDPNRSGSFMEINAGKRALSLNLKHPESREILERMIADADLVVEGFSPGTMKRMGLGYDRLRELKSDIIYVQQSGLGELGTYGRARTFGPSAQAISGISDMSGLPAPFPPAGIGYSYLDWFGAYNMATAMLAALHRREVTGLGCHIDASQGETGLYLTGTSVLDHSANGRHWERYGNRSPYRPAAPSGAYPAEGEDRWIAVSSFDEEQWQALAEALGIERAAQDPRFATLAARLEHQDELDALIGEATRSWDPFALMEKLQARGVPAGVCQNAEDRVEHDPQLAHLGWMVELEQADLGRWPVKELPTTFSATPPYIGGPWDRSGPSYGQDTDQVLAELLGLDDATVARLRSEGAL